MMQNNLSIRHIIIYIDKNTIISAADYWIIQKLNEAAREVEKLFEKKQISLAADILKTFTWNDFADNYIAQTR